jgi:hypothetical protein
VSRERGAVPAARSPLPAPDPLHVIREKRNGS